jgi:hypothetical protein
VRHLGRMDQRAEAHPSYAARRQSALEVIAVPRVLLLCLVLIVGGASAAAAYRAPRRPNVLRITNDD